MAGVSLRWYQRLRSDLRFGFHLSGCLLQTPCGFEIFQVCLGGLLFYGNAVFA
jgi:hypothetical protein